MAHSSAWLKKRERLKAGPWLLTLQRSVARAQYTKNIENSYCLETGNPCSLVLMTTLRKP